MTATLSFIAYGLAFQVGTALISHLAFLATGWASPSLLTFPIAWGAAAPRGRSAQRWPYLGRRGPPHGREVRLSRRAAI
jgi:hypothetical protein